MMKITSHLKVKQKTLKNMKMKNTMTVRKRLERKDHPWKSWKQKQMTHNPNTKQAKQVIRSTLTKCHEHNPVELPVYGGSRQKQ